MRKRTLLHPETQKRLREAEGSLKEYKPFIRVGDFGSLGKSSRIYGKTTGREHHLMSGLEEAAFLIFDYQDNVCDIREQFPLTPLAETLKIANQLQIVHPRDYSNNLPVIMTTDFLLTINCSDHFESLAVCIKTESDFNKTRVQEKLQIEREYWHRRNIRWVILLESSFNWQLVSNLRALDKLPSITKKVEEEMDTLENLILNKPQKSLERIFQIYESENNLNSGYGFFIFKYLLLTKRLKVDLTKAINLKEVYHESTADVPI